LADPAWAIASYAANDGLEWIRNYRDFLVLSEKEGWRQAYICSRDGLHRKKITPGAFDFIERIKVDQAAGIRELGRNRSYIDLSRVGIWGWSGGGSITLNAMFRKPDVYKPGIAVAPKPQPHLYNGWFQEIYMKTRKVNPEGYQASAPINFAEGLQGHLLIVHGTGETNTHIQITEGLVDRLIELGKPFDYMTYPHRDH
jgi:dipeptidyl aminopeptidase/acylaminoacyl peptidase